MCDICAGVLSARLHNLRAPLSSGLREDAQHKHDYLEGDAVVPKHIKLKLTDMLGHFDVAAAFRA